MFTGIVADCLPIIGVREKPGLVTYTLQLTAELLAGLKIGGSVAVDGVCLTAIAIDKANNLASFDAMAETLNKTTVGRLQEGKRVNVERSVTIGDEVGGHEVSGHVTGMVEIIDIQNPENNHVVTFRVAKDWMKYIFPKGFIALDGVSLTVVDVDKERGTFTVWLIPETLRRTTFGFKKAGDFVNLEIDARTQAIVDTVELYLQEHQLT